MNYWGRVWWLFQLPREISSHHRWCIGGLPLCSGRWPWRWKYHSRIVTFTPAASLITISCVINEVGSSSGKVPALTWKVRWRRLRQLILSPMRIALRGKVPTLPNKNWFWLYKLYLIKKMPYRTILSYVSIAFFSIQNLKRGFSVANDGHRIDSKCLKFFGAYFDDSFHP